MNKPIVRLSERQLSVIIKEVIDATIESANKGENYSELPTNTIMENCISVNKLIKDSIINNNLSLNETKSTFYSNSNKLDEWPQKLATDLYDTINGQIKRKGYKSFVLNPDMGLPKIPFIEDYQISINFTELDSGNPYHAQLDKVDNNGKMYFELTLNKNYYTLKSSLISFVYHEFMHAYQLSKMGKDKYIKYLNDTNYQNISNLKSDTIDNDIKDKTTKQVINTFNYYQNIVYQILYHTHKIEQAAYNSQSIGDHLNNMKNDTEYIKLSKTDKIKSLYMSRKYDELKNDLNELKQFFGEFPTKLTHAFLIRVGNVLGRNYNGMTPDIFIGILGKKIDKAYQSYCNKVGKWIDEETIKKYSRLEG